MNALASPLTYPWDRQTPDVGTLMTLRPGLHWVRMPMPTSDTLAILSPLTMPRA